MRVLSLSEEGCLTLHFQEEQQPFSMSNHHTFIL